ncbi:MAG: hypothetical protein HON53_13605, partial [Planctomycetaceae bacterium]|nr:hypothetical protein [Planctomycetaceae bacterium]
MDAYQDSSQSTPRSGHTESTKSETGSLAPTPSDMAQWKEESDRFLHDVRRRLDDILSKLETHRTDSPAPPLEQPEPPAPRDPAPENHSTTAVTPSPPTRNEDDRISALKAQLARKLHNLEETADGTPKFESGKVQSGAEIE